MLEAALRRQDTEGDPVWTMELADLVATERLAWSLAGELHPGDLVTLSGEVGAGKTTLARAVIRYLTKDPWLDVPSPTFTIMQGYDSQSGPVVHADFYRLNGATELDELGWDEESENAIALVEWPDRAGSALKQTRLDIRLDFDPRTGRRSARLEGRGAFAPRLALFSSLRNVLDRSGWGDAARTPIQGDASTRIYERLAKPNGASAVLMISPQRPDGPPVRRGKPYSAIAKLAETVHAFVAVDQGLVALGFSAPRIYGKDLDAGILVLEDLGCEPVADAGAPVAERYAEATKLLARLHRMALPFALPVTNDLDHRLSPYDNEAMCIETELLLDWYLPQIRGNDPSGSVRGEFNNLWSQTLAEVLAAPPTWTLRDFHSPNLLWLEQREGLQRVGLLDFQDAVIGPPAYDLVSLLQDARVTVPADLELKLLALYGRERVAADPSFNLRAFAAHYAIMGAQRATKILGIFVRLNIRDGKPDYLKHLPRIEAYLVRNLAHPALIGLKGWYKRHLPHLFAGEV